MNDDFKNKQAKVVSYLNDYSNLLMNMVGDNNDIQKLVDKVTDMAKGLSTVDAIFDNFENIDSSYGFEVFETNNEYMEWLISRLNTDRNNGDLIRIIENTLNLLMTNIMCEIRTFGTVKAKGIISGIEKMMKKSNFTI